jgi:hypothetical protein
MSEIDDAGQRNLEAAQNRPTDIEAVEERV